MLTEGRKDIALYKYRHKLILLKAFNPSIQIVHVGLTAILTIIDHSHLTNLGTNHPQIVSFSISIRLNYSEKNGLSVVFVLGF